MRKFKKRYQSRRTYENARKRKEYNKYLREFLAKRKMLEDRGLTPYDSIPYSYEEYFSIKNEKKQAGEINIQRNIIQEQLYKYSYETATSLKEKLIEEGILEGKYSIQKIRTGDDFDIGEILSGVNEDLKQKYPNMTGKQRAEWIRKEWFGYAS